MENTSDERLAAALRHLRGLYAPCVPPIGVGSFDVLYASEHEVVVWYSPAKEEHRAGEVTIPCACLADALNALEGGEVLDEAALCRVGGSVARGRWLLAVLALLPGVAVRSDPLLVSWSPPPVHTVESPRAKRKTRVRSKKSVLPDGAA